MEPHISKKLDARRLPRHLLGLKGKRVLQRVTFNPSTANPGETLYIQVPVLPTSVGLIPDTLALIATVTIPITGSGHANNRAVGDLGNALIAKRIVKIGNKEIESLTRPDLVELYADLWRTKEELSHLIQQGIHSEAVAKHRSGAGDKNSDANDIAIAAAFPKYRIPLCGVGALTIFSSHGALPTKDLPEIRLEVTLAPSSDVIVSSDSTKVGAYKLENIELEYQTIEPDNQNLALAPPPRIVFNHLVHHKTISFDKTKETVISDVIQTQRRSFVGLLGLFVNPHTAGTRNTKAFANPGVTKVEFDLDGQSNVLFQHGMLPCDIWTGAIAGAEWLVGKKVQPPSKFFSSEYSLWIDLRAARDATVHGDGRNSQGPGRHIQYRIHRTADSGSAAMCNLHLYILSEAAFELEDGELYK